jgi:signal transduction histidine kinase
MTARDRPKNSPALPDDIVRALDHDLRNPVANILGYVDLLRDTPGAEYTPEQLEFMTRIEDNCRGLLAIVHQLLETERRRRGS